MSSQSVDAELRPPKGARKRFSLRDMDYSVVQQCMHCGMCLPTCPTYVETKLERHGPRGRIALMRAVADGKLDVSRAFSEEMYYCLGCLACQTACPAGVDYARLFETARAEIESHGKLVNGERDFWRWLALKTIFQRPWLLRLVGRFLWLYQVTGLQSAIRKSGLLRFLPANLRKLEPQTPVVCQKFSHQLIREQEVPRGEARFRVGLLTGCVQDLVFSDINRDTADVLLENGCEVFTPHGQVCCGSLHAHNGEPELAAQLARKLIRMFEPGKLDAIISNAGGCGSHLKHFSALLGDDPEFAALAEIWDSKVRDIHEWLVEIGFRKPEAAAFDQPQSATYHESCHLCHGQKVVGQPREVLRSIPGLELLELVESNWCCGSAGIYNITQPETAAKLQDRKVEHVLDTGAGLVATSNPGCHLQLLNGLRGGGTTSVDVTQPVSLLAKAYRNEKGR